MQERHRQARHLGLVRVVGRSRPGIYRGGFSSLAISPHVCSHWVLGSRPGMASPCDIGLAGRCPRPRGAGPLRRCGASWRSPASRFALAVRCVRCLPMGRHHFALRSRPHAGGSTAPYGSPLSARMLSRRRGSRRLAKPLAASLRGWDPLALTTEARASSVGLARAGFGARCGNVATFRSWPRHRRGAPSGYRAASRRGSLRRGFLTGPDPVRKPGGRAFARVRISAPSPCRAGPAAMSRGRLRPPARRLCRTC